MTKGAAGAAETGDEYEQKLLEQISNKFFIIF
jgi:hypothetical protein